MHAETTTLLLDDATRRVVEAWGGMTRVPPAVPLASRSRRRVCGGSKHRRGHRLREVEGQRQVAVVKTGNRTRKSADVRPGLFGGPCVRSPRTCPWESACSALD